MSRRLLLLLVVPALVGTMVGVGAATLRTTQSATATEDDGQAAPAVERSETEFDLGFSREPSGLAETELAAADPSKAADDGEEFSYNVKKVQQQLADLDYYVGPIDGEAGASMASAVMAFQKVQGIGADGSVGPQTLKALRDPKPPSLKGGAANRVEVDLTKQVLYFVQGDNLVRILPVSSGSGSTYQTSSGGTARSLTPVGTYAVQRKISGVREAPLGTLYDPMYFYQGWAIHGSNSVPAYPASHGCIRVTRSDALWLFPKMPVGFQVKIYGGTHVFTAGSSAPGTSEPAGDTAEDAEPTDEEQDKPGGKEPDDEPTKPKPEPEPEPEPTTSPKPEPDPDPDPTTSPEPEPDPEEPLP